jgi:hypothetical protein
LDVLRLLIKEVLFIKTTKFITHLSGLVQEWTGSNVWIDVAQVECGEWQGRVSESDEHGSVNGWVSCRIWLALLRYQMNNKGNGSLPS